MTLTIDVKPEIAHRWREIAKSEGRELEAVISDAMEDRKARQAAEDADDIAVARRELASDEPRVSWAEAA